MMLLAAARAPAHIAAAAFALGLVGDLYRPAVSAAVADVVPPLERTRAYGYLYWAINLGVAGASMLAGFVADVSWWLLFACDAGTSLLFGLVVLAGLPETRPAHLEAHARSSWSLPYRDARFLSFVGIQFLVAIVFQQFTVALALDMQAHGITPRQYGLIVAWNGILIVLFQPTVMRWLRRLPRPRVLAAGALAVGLGFGINAFAGGAAVYLAGLVVWTLGEMGSLPLAPAVIADFAPTDARGGYQGAYQLAWGVAGFAAPALGSLTLAHGGPLVLWGGCAALGAIACALHLLDFGRVDLRRGMADLSQGAAGDRDGSQRAGVGR
jgi:MFS family permease